jgi:histone-lysine N-methyltransferase SETMAR
MFIQDKAAPHKAAITRQKLADLHLEVLKHPAYSPDLAPSDYYLFPDLFLKPKTYQFDCLCCGRCDCFA